MLDETEFDRWRAAADEAVRGASVQMDAALFNWACFLAEQAAQLATKALLHGIGAAAWGHDLVALGRLVSDATTEPLPPEVAAALRRLSRHYLPARYPDAHPSGPPGAHYGQEDAAAARLDAQGVLAFVDATWSALRALAGGTEHGT